ncbi:hypothetical protein SGGBAA2069_c21870 [Streptococcus gallolyticus subsp. gallolyticus ATCC BAA-2069]|nr:hypothetical protein SGGBAA2069_c21870 [Streptococcus gallolyticus subsp. gallolyticus ATCC BAA-2069]
MRVEKTSALLFFIFIKIVKSLVIVEAWGAKIA